MTLETMNTALVLTTLWQHESPNLTLIVLIITIGNRSLTSVQLHFIMLPVFAEDPVMNNLCASFTALLTTPQWVNFRNDISGNCFHRNTLDISILHYHDVIMSAMASQITSLMIVYSTFYSGTDQRKHQSSASLPFVQGIHRWPVNSPHKAPVTRKMFPYDDVIMYWYHPLNSKKTFTLGLSL